ncbi:hypothetical protein ONS95_004590 [Cadophora gregata]|uniref:uncharacterized protein n=1 Tax=Cadophora gregata TaxID=51156 RepID=UPI0026DCD0C9|nr:uncharacterized protein ONS95_004590 [Cadophora gregata]KAK0105042.1 hypothetical protein ONS96_004447 [Cadophora gregata f. sp. sojae]KAK0106086.1 hypothetical protein ONS95_004590 [Cadophora gregata]
MDTDDTIEREIYLNTLPSSSSYVFEESAYFSRNGPGCSLPSPAEVRRLRDPLSSGASETAKFEALGLIVKFGREITIAEGQCLWAIRQHFHHHQVSVPEVYGWCEESGEVFIYMELIQGITLEDRWESLPRQERLNVCEQLRAMLVELRTLRQDPNYYFLGHINRQPLLDIVFTNSTKPPAGPFSSVKEFHDWLSYLTKRGKATHWPDPSLIPDPCRVLLPDDSLITFTHSDLHPRNIMVSADGPCRILALVDWHQSGWYPDYWEYCKAVYTADPGGEWETEYIPRFVEVPTCYDAWAFYPRTLGY